VSIFMRSIRNLFGIMLAFPVGACSGVADFYENKSGVRIPTPSNLTEYSRDTQTGNLGAGEYVVASLSYTNERCHAFFNILEHFKQDSELIDKVITAAVAAGSPLLALTAASKTTQALVVSSLSFGNQYNHAAADIFAFAAYKEQLMTHVFDGMAAYIKKLRDGGINTLIDPKRVNDNTFLSSRQPVDLMLARSIAADYASLCSLATMREIVSQALNNTKTGISAPAGAANDAGVLLQPSAAVTTTTSK